MIHLQITGSVVIAVGFGWFALIRGSTLSHFELLGSILVGYPNTFFMNINAGIVSN